MSGLPVNLLRTLPGRASARKSAASSTAWSRRLFSSPSLRPISASQNPRQTISQTPFRPRFQPQRHLPLSRPSSTSAAVPTVSSTSPPTTDSTPDLRPAYILTFTCKPCGHRSSHRVTKQGYHHGTVLIKCPSCKNRHVISDHLKVFLDQKSSLEDILAKKMGDGTPLTSLIKKGTLGRREGQLVGREGDEDIEFWEDGSETVHTPVGEKEGGANVMP